MAVKTTWEGPKWGTGPVIGGKFAACTLICQLVAAKLTLLAPMRRLDRDAAALPRITPG